MVTSRFAGAALIGLALIGCDRGRGDVPPPKQGAQGYFVFRPANPQQGWDVISAVRTGLPTADAKRIRTSGIIDSRRPDMYIDADAQCARDLDLVRVVQRIAREQGIAKVTCNDTLPGAL